MAAQKKNGSGVRETSPGKFVASMYDPRVKGGTKHIGTFKVGKGPNDFRTRTEAERAAKKAKAEAERQRDLQLKAEAGGETVRSFATRWPRDYARPAPTTNAHNADRVKALIADFGDRPLDSIDPMEAHHWIHGGIVPEQIRKVARKWKGAKVHPDGDVEVPNHRGNHMVVRAMFNDAVKTGGLVASNPFASLNVPEAPGRRGDSITVVTEAELALLVKTAHEVLGDFGVHFATLLETMAWTGMRPGEVWALNIEPGPTWNYPDFAAGEVHVKFQIDRFGNKRLPKWDRKGKGRAVFMLPPAQSALRRAIEDRPSGEVFYTTNGKRMTGRNVGYYWDKVRVAFWSELPTERRSKTREKDGGAEMGKIPIDFDLYELRHYFGTQLAEMGLTPPEIADQMGHKDGGQLAMQRYIHPRKESVKRSMLERFAEHERRKAIGE
jgi:integrase